MAFGDWLLSFNITFSSFIQGLSHVTVLYSFLWLNLILLCGYITFCLSIPQLKNGFPFLSAASGEETPCQCRRHRFYPWVRKIPWRKKWQPTPVFCLGTPMERWASQATVHGVTKRVRHDWATEQQLWSLRCGAWWIDLCTSWNDYHNKFSEHPSSHIDIKSKK